MTPVPTPNWTHPATVVRVIDGDTILMRIDTGRYWGSAKWEGTGPIRIAGLFAPERREKGGAEAADHLAELLLLPRPIVVTTRKPDPRDPYGRVVAEVWVGDVNVAEAMIAAGHGVAMQP